MAIAAPLLYSSVVRAEAPWRDLDLAYGRGVGLRACVDEAKRERPGAWTCVGGVLTTTATGPGGRVQVSSRLIMDDFQDTTGQPLEELAVWSPAAGAGDDYDSWCEHGTVCARKINDSTAEVKGNGAYGDERGVIGAMDFVVRQSFNGPFPRWRGLLIWDYGPTIIPNEFYNACRINLSFRPDDYCGVNTMHFGNIDSRNRRTWWPSPAGYDQLRERLKGNTKYHDDNYGSFHAAGYPQTFNVGVIHTGRWKNCGSRTGCRYYQVPWMP